jgi:hypothetical protein
MITKINPFKCFSQVDCHSNKNWLIQKKILNMPRWRLQHDGIVQMCTIYIEMWVCTFVGIYTYIFFFYQLRGLEGKTSTSKKHCKHWFLI